MSQCIYEVFKRAKTQVVNGNIMIDDFCNDSYIGDYEKDKYYIPTHSLSDNKTLLFGKKIGESDDKTESIAIIIESPHVDEFIAQPYLPAQGVTGINLKGYLSRLFFELENQGHLNKDKYKVLLVNSIQYQCSLGYPTTKYRDRMWGIMWNDSKVKDDFKQRIKDISPSIIINLCTKSSESSSAKDRRTQVQKAVEEVNRDKRNVKFFIGNHPSSWGSERNRYIYCNKNSNQSIRF